MPGALAETIAFYFLAVIAAGSALGCVVASNIVRMATCLLGTLAAVALLYFLLAANFLGAIQLIVYAGGTLVVIVFGVMLTSRVYGSRLKTRPLETAVGLLVCAALFVGLVTVLVRTAWPPAAASPASPDVAQLGSALLSTYLVPFELASVLLLAVMIGAAYLAQPGGQRARPTSGPSGTGGG
jgi:NADH:ubiquinone oxidoreductase subunit 6 (subunit J)